MAAVIVALLMGLVFLGLRQPKQIPVAEVQPIVDPGVAVLTQVMNATWLEESPRPGDAMAPGAWTLTEGMAELEFYSGASVILEAPAKLEILSENGGVLHAGRLRADVPHHAHGFTITTESVELVDLGTSFGMEVGPDSETTVHVFDGEVELFEPESGRPQGEGDLLLAGEGRVVALSGEVNTIVADDSRFVSPSQMGFGAQVRLEQGYQDWRESIAEVDTDSRLLVHYAFEGTEGRSLTYRSSTKFDGLQGAVIGAQWSEGRWPRKDALDFKRPSDRVLIEVPEVVESMTLFTWVRIDGFDNAFNSLLLSDGWDRPGAVHWQIRNQGEVELAVWHGKEETPNSRAPFMMQPSDFGRWIQLAAVYDGEAGTVSHYRDGELTGVVELPHVVPLAIGKAEIGNWSPPAEKTRQVRNFNGRMDELIIFKNALSSQEIEALYHDGKP